MGATGVNLATGQSNQPITQNDPDSLKSTPGGGLMLSSGDDGQLIFVLHPGTDDQKVAFLSLITSIKAPVSGLDDAIFPGSEAGTFYLSDTGNNRVLKIEVEDIAPGSLYACVGSVNQFVRVDLHTGVITSVVTTLSAPHGLAFVPNRDENAGDNEGSDR
jgi:molybdopterin-binding protein